MELTMLGTGNAGVTKCYNTCFVLSEEGRHILVDGGGGNGLLQRFKQAGLDWMDMKHIIVTHKHVDHLLGIVWMLRFILQNMNRGKFQGEAWIYGHNEVVETLDTLARLLLSEKETKLLGERLHLVEVHDGDGKNINVRNITFFDIGSTKEKQFGFMLELDDGKLCCCGDEPYRECEEVYANGAKWLLHEAFCLSSEADEFKPYEKHHTTVADGAKLAEELKVENLLLYHTEDKNILRRKELYSAEAREYFHGNIFVPDDLEKIIL